ncbi:MAG: Type pilus assembly protein PilM [Candidatus Parcubacteria bacterium]|jgi:hypothetical protein
MMLYLYLDKNQIKLLYLKKTLLGQFESAFYEKKHQVDLLDKEHVNNTDVLASAIKEAITSLSPSQVKDKEVCLILPQKAFYYVRAEVPKDIAPSAVTPFIKDKARANIPTDIDNCLFDYYIQENEKEKQIIFYAISKDVLKKYHEAFSLINLQITALVPESLAYFKLFEKTLRKDKKEYILYANLDVDRITGYLYDSYGPLDAERTIETAIKETTNIEKILKQEAVKNEEKGKKINRLILSGDNSESVRQDTFTKQVGIWTNPLKKIIPEFYQDYLKLLVSNQTTPIQFLKYDVCIGAFIFSLENKNFSFFKKRAGDVLKKTTFSRPQVKLPLKEISLFVGSFALSFVVLLGLSKLNMSPLSFLGNNQTIVTVTPSPLPVSPSPTFTPTPAIARAEVKVKVLNGSGIAGKANDVKDALKAKGYEEILTGNADNFEYTTTEIQVKKSTPNLGNAVKNDLADNVASPTITTLEESSTADVIVIVAKDFK